MKNQKEKAHEPVLVEAVEIAKTHNVEVAKATELLSDLPMVIQERTSLVEEFEEIKALPIDSPDTWKRARELRLKVLKNRTQGIEAWHKKQKAFFLTGGRFVDAIKNKEIAVNVHIEEYLIEIEKYEEKMEAKRRDELR